MDPLLDEGRTGPRHLSQPPVAAIAVSALRHCADVLRYGELHAFVVMPNHVHLLVTPLLEAPKLTKSLTAFTARRANGLLGLTGRAFWQAESFDRWVRNRSEFNRIKRYIENNPVRAELVAAAEEFPWSSAWVGPANVRTRWREGTSQAPGHEDSGWIGNPVGKPPAEEEHSCVAETGQTRKDDGLPLSK